MIRLLLLASPSPPAALAGLDGMGGLAIVAGIVAIALLGARVLYSLRADRRYARLLEDEVANQTRSLMSSLAATASTERSLRLVMESVPDAILVLDPDGRVLDANAAGRELVAGGEGGGFEWLDATSGRIARENLAAAFTGALRRFEVPFTRADGTESSPSRATSRSSAAPRRSCNRPKNSPPWGSW